MFLQHFSEPEARISQAPKIMHCNQPGLIVIAQFITPDLHAIVVQPSGNKGPQRGAVTQHTAAPFGTSQAWIPSNGGDSCSDSCLANNSVLSPHFPHLFPGTMLSIRPCTHTLTKRTCSRAPSQQPHARLSQGHRCSPGLLMHIFCLSLKPSVRSGQHDLGLQPNSTSVYNQRNGGQKYLCVS